MLVITRTLGEKLIIDEDIEVKVIDINGGQVRIGIDAPKDVMVHREEIHRKIQAELTQDVETGS